MTTKKEELIKEQQEAKDYLIKLFSQEIKEGKQPRIKTILKHVSSSGMMRHIDAVYISRDGETIKLNWYIEKLGLYKRGKSYDSKNCDSLRVGGCGMDMGFAIVYNLSSTLYRQGFICMGKDCRSNDHNNGDTNYKRTKNHIHSDGGYLLKQEWL